MARRSASPLDWAARSTRCRIPCTALVRLVERDSAYKVEKVSDPKLGVKHEALRRRVIQAQVDQGQVPGESTETREEVRRLRIKVRELEETNEILRGIDFSRGTGPTTPRSAARTPLGPCSHWGLRSHAARISTARRLKVVDLCPKLR